MNPKTVNAHSILRICGVALLLSAGSYAQTAVAQSKTIAVISAVSGPVQVVGKLAAKQAARGTQLSESDSIKTQKGGIAQIKFNDGSSFTVYENSSIRIEYYKKRPAAERGLAETTFDVLNGKLKFFVNPKAKEKANTKFRTKTAVMGIRGTSGIISIGTDGSTQLVVLTGLVEVKNPKIPEFSVSVAPNFSTRIATTSAPETPAPISQEAVKNLLPNVPQGAEFTEDGPATVRPQTPDSPANEQKQQDQPAEGRESGSTAPNQPKSEEPSSKPSANRKAVQSRPIFAPGGGVVNRNNLSTDSNSSSFRAVGATESNGTTTQRESVQAETTVKETPLIESQPTVIQQNIGTTSRVVESVQSVIERTVDEATDTVKERVVEQLRPVIQPQKVKVNISLPGD